MSWIQDGPGRGYQTPEQRATADAQAQRNEAYEGYLARRAGGQQAPKPMPERVPMGSEPDTAPDTTDAQAMRDKAMNDWLAKRHGKEPMS